MRKDNKTLVLEAFEKICKKSVDIGCGARLGHVYKYFPILINKYDRPYHNFDHIYSGLYEIQLLPIFKNNQEIRYYRELVLAWIVHDIYVGCKQAELLSVLFAQHLICDLGLKIKDEIVSDLILETAPESYFVEGPSKTGMYEADLIHDIDFMQFGQEWDVFIKCNDNIDDEYGYRLVPSARASFLETILKMNHIFRTDKYRDKYEIQAVRNIRRLLNERYYFLKP